MISSGSGSPTSLVAISISGGVAEIVMNDPARLNALNDELRQDLVHAFAHCLEDDRVNVIVFTGAGSCFSAGGDLGSMPPPDEESGRMRLEQLGQLVSLMKSCSKPVVAAVKGAAAGAAVGLACTADIVIAGEQTRFLLPFSRLGLTPDAGLTYLLPERVGHSTARRLLIEGATVEASEAARIGLVDYVVPEAETNHQAIEYARRLQERSSQSIAAIKSQMAEPVVTLSSALEHESAAAARTLSDSSFYRGQGSLLREAKTSIPRGRWCGCYRPVCLERRGRF